APVDGSLPGLGNLGARLIGDNKPALRINRHADPGTLRRLRDRVEQLDLEVLLGLDELDRRRRRLLELGFRPLGVERDEANDTKGSQESCRHEKGARLRHGLPPEDSGGAIFDHVKRYAPEMPRIFRTSPTVTPRTDAANLPPCGCRQAAWFVRASFAAFSPG